MSSRDAILRAVRERKPSHVPLAPLPAFETPAGDLRTPFQQVTHQIGGRVINVSPGEVAGAVGELFPAARVVASMVPDLVRGTARVEDFRTADELARLDVLICRGVLGIAENGAVWLPEHHMGHRAAPFLTQHLVIVLDGEELVWTMHQAYERVRVGADGFGAFIAGPSKTADIEQALVIGAHGPRSLTVLLT